MRNVLEKVGSRRHVLAEISAITVFLLLGLLVWAYFDPEFRQFLSDLQNLIAGLIILGSAWIGYSATTMSARNQHQKEREDKNIELIIGIIETHDYLSDVRDGLYFIITAENIAHNKGNKEWYYTHKLFLEKEDVFKERFENYKMLPMGVIIRMQAVNSIVKDLIKLAKLMKMSGADDPNIDRMANAYRGLLKEADNRIVETLEKMKIDGMSIIGDKIEQDEAYLEHLFSTYSASFFHNLTEK